MDPQDLRRTHQDEIGGILWDPALRGARLSEAIVDLGARHDIEPFRACLHRLAGLERPEAAARPLLEEIDRHRASLEARLGRDPGLGVAALDFLHGLEGTIRDPIFREEGEGAPRATRSAGPGSIDEILALEVRRGERFGRPLAVAVLAPDGEGATAEGTMNLAAAAVKEALRDTDQAVRLVPQGFALILPCTPAGGAQQAAERLCRALRTATGTTWSAGLAACPDLAWDADALGSHAREALAAARAAGGDAARRFRPERRDHPRKGVGAALVATVRRDGAETPAEVRDLSVGGALLFTRARLDPGSEVQLALRETSARPREVLLPSRVVRAEVVHDEAAPGAAGEPLRRAGVSFQAEAEARFRVAGLLAGIAEPDVPGREGRP